MAAWILQRRWNYASIVFSSSYIGEGCWTPRSWRWEGKNTLDLQILTIKELAHILKMLGRTSLLQPCVGLLFN